MEIHVLVYSNTQFSFEATDTEIFLTETEAANAMVEQIRGIYPDYHCVDNPHNPDATNIEGLHVGTCYAYDDGYTNNWVIIKNELNDNFFVNGLLLSEFHKQYNVGESFDGIILKLIQDYCKCIGCISDLIKNGNSIENILNDIVGSTLYHTATDNLKFDMDDLDEVVDYLNSDEIDNILPNTCNDSNTIHWMKIMLMLANNEQSVVKSVQAEIDKMLNPYKDLNLQDGFRELCQDLSDDEFYCLLDEIKKARELKTHNSFPSHQAAYQDLCIGMKKRFFEIVSEKGWDWVEEHLSFRCDLKFEGYCVSGEHKLALNWYCGDDDVAYTLDRLEHALEA